MGDEWNEMWDASPTNGGRQSHASPTNFLTFSFFESNGGRQSHASPTPVLR